MPLINKIVRYFLMVIGLKALVIGQGFTLNAFGEAMILPLRESEQSKIGIF